MFRAGQILFGPFPTGERKDRPCLVLIDEQSDGQVLLTYTSTKIDFLADITTILPQGCHPDITRDSCVVYEEALLVRGNALRNAVSSGLYRFNPSSLLNPKLISKIHQGIETSDLTAEQIRNYAKYVGVI